MSVRIDVRLGQFHPQGLHTAERRDPIEDRVGQGLLKIVATSARNLGDLSAEEIIIPGTVRIVVGRAEDVIPSNGRTFGPFDPKSMMGGPVAPWPIPKTG